MLVCVCACVCAVCKCLLKGKLKTLCAVCSTFRLMCVCVWPMCHVSENGTEGHQHSSWFPESSAADTWLEFHTHEWASVSFPWPSCEVRGHTPTSEADWRDPNPWVLETRWTSQTVRLRDTFRCLSMRRMRWRRFLWSEVWSFTAEINFHFQTQSIRHTSCFSTIGRALFISQHSDHHNILSRYRRRQKKG